MSTSKPGLVSVILVNFRGADDTLTCVRELLQAEWPRDLLEIVVVDNASGDDSVARLRTVDDPRVRVVESPRNSGFAGGCNLGVAEAHGEFVAFLNNDARPDGRWIAEAIATFESRPDVGAVASKVLDWEGERVDFVDAAVTWYGMGYKPHTGEVDRDEWSVERDVLFGTGAAMFVRRDVFERLGGFDESYFMFYEDVDFGWRLNLAGYRFRFQPRSLAFHKHHASMKSFGAYREEYLLERNALATLYKNLDDDSLARVLPGAILLAVRRAVARGELDSAALDLRVVGDDSEVAMPVAKSAIAGLFAIDRFVEGLEDLDIKRAAVQSSRRRSDSDLLGLFGELDEPAYPMAEYQSGYETIVKALRVLPAGRRNRVIVITGDPLGEKMAGPAIRAWNIAKALSVASDVRLLSLGRVAIDGDGFAVASVSYHRPSSMNAHEEWADVIVLQGHALALFPSLQSTAKVVVVDLYDPMHLEQLEQGRNQSLERWNEQVLETTDLLNHQIGLGDFFLAASERQRSFWLGQLAGSGRINAYTYSRDEDLRSLIDVVPFGMEEHDPHLTRHAIRGSVPGINETDKVVVWGGGIYDWFDPQTLVRAIASVAERHDDVRLFFLGVRHPNPDVPEMTAVARTRQLSAELGLTGKHVFFNEEWVDYADRQNYLLDADLGVSTHFQHVETTFSFRTRILDYLWAGLPIVTTDGDSFGELVAARGLGAAVSERDVDALADAIERYLYDAVAVSAARAAVAVVREEFRWSRTLEPLVRFVSAPRKAADREPVSREAVGQQHARRTRATGWRRDLQRVRYYLANGGPSVVAEKVRARLARR
ncbi:glycosyltransferase [Leifsonia aquatica]|uniref:glycosyltransferase n=1 Tax=Leifsonia aquatica TaxID=144185 RepID=UPI00046816A1|nr:glycosyltransferase [Leifsonia aquatica]